MKAFSIGYLCLIFVVLQSSAPSDSATQIITRLSAVHPLKLYYSENNERQAFIVDNDGNMYVTKWDLGTKNSDEFESDISNCDKSVYHKMILEHTLDFKDIKEEEISPSVFKEHGQCIMDRGYTLTEKGGFAPEKFKLSIIRTHSKSSTYIPVGTVFFIAKTHSRYIDVYKHLTWCDAQAKNNNLGIVEDYGNQYIQVSIKPYVDSIKLCFTEAGYTLESSDE
jgi:hypothetical protein